MQPTARSRRLCRLSGPLATQPAATAATAAKNRLSQTIHGGVVIAAWPGAAAADDMAAEDDADPAARAAGSAVAVISGSNHSSGDQKPAGFTLRAASITVETQVFALPARNTSCRGSAVASAEHGLSQLAGAARPVCRSGWLVALAQAASAFRRKRKYCL